jgi:site-specific DNA-methyltransferase (adenine-specific)
MPDLATNVLYYGDNLDILRRYLPDAAVDLVYLDPPFNSNRDYNVIFRDESGNATDAQLLAFEDTWHWGPSAEATYAYLTNTARHEGRVPDKVSTIIAALRAGIGENQMMAYLVEMAVRLVELHRVLRPTGSLYLHCDPTASHYLKLMLDATFGTKNFRNEIILAYAGGGIPKNDFPRKHDVILRYTKTDTYFFTPDYRPYSAGTVQRGRTAVKGKYFDEGLNPEGTPVNDWWPDVPKITSPTDPEKLGYPTQKSVALLERIVRTSSRPGDVVLDPF